MLCYVRRSVVMLRCYVMLICGYASVVFLCNVMFDVALSCYAVVLCCMLLRCVMFGGALGQWRLRYCCRRESAGLRPPSSL